MGKVLDLVIISGIGVLVYKWLLLKDCSLCDDVYYSAFLNSEADAIMEELEGLSVRDGANLLQDTNKVVLQELYKRANTKTISASFLPKSVIQDNGLPEGYVEFEEEVDDVGYTGFVNDEGTVFVSSSTH